RVCFVQAEGGIRAATVTGVQTCALPILRYGVPGGEELRRGGLAGRAGGIPRDLFVLELHGVPGAPGRDPLPPRRRRPRRVLPYQIGRASCRERLWGVARASGAHRTTEVE